MDSKHLRCFLLQLSLAGVLILSIGAGIAAAQGIRGTISGTVADQSKGVVPNATVRLINTQMNLEAKITVSNAEGVYRFLEVEPAVYELVATAPGFAQLRATEVKVEPNRNLQIPLILGVSGTSELVTVTATEILIDHESATLGTTVNRARIERLPLNGRNVLELAALQPGVTRSQNPTLANFGTGIGYVVGGGRGVENNITLDGANNNEIASGGSTGVQPRPDAVSEFRILTSSFEAEFGRNAGSIINVVTRSGGNDFHGNARSFWRPTKLSAARYFDNADATRTGDKRRRYERKEIGFNLGGPVYIPGLYNGRAKTFFFVDFEIKRQLIGATQVVTGLPTAAELTGDFSGLGYDIMDPATGNPFSGNKIPNNRFSPIANFYLGYLPPADASGKATVSANEITNNDYLTWRVDHQITNNNTLAFSSNYYDQYILSPFAFYGADVPGFGSLDKRTTWNFVLRDAHSFSPLLANSFLAAYARNGQPSLSPQNTTSPSAIGFKANFVVEPRFAGPPQIALYERGLTFGNSYQGPSARVTENFQIQDGVSWFKSDHRIKFGFDGTLFRWDQTFLFINNGAFGFSGIHSGNTTGDDLADFMIGNTVADMQFGNNGLRDYRQKMMAAFFQDAWKLGPQLTLTLGVRYEYSSPITDLFNRVNYYRLGATSQLLTQGKLKTMEGTPIIVPSGGRAPNGVVYVGDPDPTLGGTVPRGGVAKDFNNWAPRIAIAYAPKGGNGFLSRLLGGDKTVIRTGFGIYYGAIIGDTALQQLRGAGYAGSSAHYWPASGTFAEPFAPDPYPNYAGSYFNADLGQNPDPFANLSEINVGAPLNSAGLARPIDPGIRTPYTCQYNLTAERGFGKDYVMTLSYVGSRGVKLYSGLQINPAYGTFIPAPAGITIPTPTSANINDRRVNTDIIGGLDQFSTAGYSSYNSLQAQVQKRLSAGLEFQAAYTFSKTVTDSDNSRDNLDIVDRRVTRSLSSQDIPHKFIASWLYELPLSRLIPSAPGRLMKGWSIDGIVTFQSGMPFSVTNPYNTEGAGGAIISYSDIGADFTQMDPRKSNNRAFNSTAFKTFGSAASGFVLARDYRRGTSKRNMFRLNNGINEWDLVVSKKTALRSEGSNLEIRFEMFNALNHASFENADLNISNQAKGTFGTFISTREPRVIQLVARIGF